MARHDLTSDNDWIAFSVVSNREETPTLQVDSITSEGFQDQATTSNTKLVFKNTSNIGSFEMIDQTNQSLSVNKNTPYYMTLFSTVHKPELAGDYSITPTVTVTCS